MMKVDKISISILVIIILISIVIAECFNCNFFYTLTGMAVAGIYIILFEDPQ